MREEQVYQEYITTTVKPISDASSKKTLVQDRAIVAGKFVVINGYRVNLVSLKRRFGEGGYLVHETKHFLLLLRDEAPSVIVVHWFAPEEMDADVKHYLTQELKPYGVITQSQHYGEILSGIVGSLFPGDVRRAWRYFGANTLQRFVTFLATAYTPPLPVYSTIGSFP